LFKTSNGKYIAPQMIEGLLLVDKFVEQVCVVADQRKFVSALIVPDFEILEEWAADNGVSYANREELCQDRRVNKLMAERIETLTQGLASYEKIKKFTLMAHHFSMESGELTNTLKLKRSVIYKNFKDTIDKMYEA
ncbi:MAG: long-chain fatty acid--CoA ligase, partial [Prevotella sp.]|nr:long-chain fatty acid--CoA ligase [Prevotella sp.]